MTKDKAVKFWEQATPQIEKIMSARAFETWIKPLIPLKLEPPLFELGAPKKFLQEWVEDHYATTISAVLKDLYGQPLNLIITNIETTTTEKDTTPTTGQFFDDSQNTPKNRSLPFKKEDLAASINSKYTFNKFVVGNSNRFAYAAAKAVSEAPAKVYNPLFLYGGVGLGKTHLMHAIGNEIKANNPALNVLYISSEIFTNELINSIRDKNPESFRQKYRNIDCLMVDDIQFLANKDRTQEEFFHTFNTLYSANKQIIISSDRLPKEIPTLEDRLRSRFECGLITDIQPPDIETRIAILRKKALLENIDMPNDVISLLASKIENNIRELEGAFVRIIAFASINALPITMETACAALKDIIDTSSGKPVTIEKIQEVACTHFKIRQEELIAKKRTKNIVYPRQIAMYLSRELTDASLPMIGERFGGRDHTTVIHAIEKIKKEMTENPELRNTIKLLTKKISS